MGEVVAKLSSRVLLMLVLFAWASPSFSQEKEETLRYEIVVLGLKIGELKAQKLAANPEELTYQVDSSVKFWFFGNLELSFKTRSNFQEDRIVNTTSTSKTNRGDFYSTIRWNGKHYEVDANTYHYENQKPVEGPLSWCSAKLFFEEPNPEDIFLSEVYGVTQKIIQIEPGVYEIKIDGNKNRYFYQSGVLEKVVLENPIKNYQIRRLR